MLVELFGLSSDGRGRYILRFLNYFDFFSSFWLIVDRLHDRRGGIARLMAVILLCFVLILNSFAGHPWDFSLLRCIARRSHSLTYLSVVGCGELSYDVSFLFVVDWSLLIPRLGLLVD